MSKPTAADFLKNMSAMPAALGKPINGDQAPEQAASAKGSKPVNSRAHLKHIGGYFDTETVEKVAVLRARLKLDNSELIKLAIEDLYRKQGAKRAFGD